jgi:divalent metal cation (Fe/Co/Zn/Cd) transporter
MINRIIREVNEVKGVLAVANVRVRPSGPDYFIDFNIGINRHESHRVVHAIVGEVREKLAIQIPNSDIVIGTFPVDTQECTEREVYRTVKKVVDRFPNCTNIHNIHVYEISGEKFIAIHIEVKESMTLKESHDLSHEIGGLIQHELHDVKDVSVNFEYVKQQYIIARDITAESAGLIEKICSLVNKCTNKFNCHDIKVYSEGKKLTVFLHCEMNDALRIETIESISKAISNKIKNNFGGIANIHVHVEPIGEKEAF